MKAERMKIVFAIFSIMLLVLGSNSFNPGYSLAPREGLKEPEIPNDYQFHQPGNKSHDMTQTVHGGVSNMIANSSTGHVIVSLMPDIGGQGQAEVNPPIKMHPGFELTPGDPPKQHYSTEPEEGEDDCKVPVTPISIAGYKPVISEAPVGIIFPEWKPVNDPANRVIAILEGRVTAAEVAWHDLPIYHYSHDMTFHVIPDRTADNRYTNLLGIQVDGDTGRKTQQGDMEVEWETGLAAGNSGNPLASHNTLGWSGGFFSAGHAKGALLSYWPTPGDRVHVEGLWIWDRGHPPARTEIHPPRLVATERHLPTTVPLTNYVDAKSNIFGTEIDIFASGDAGALYNNRPNNPDFVKDVAMNIRDYTFTMKSIINQPSSESQLKWSILKGPGDTFSGEPKITTSPQKGDMPATVTVTIPWKSNNVPNTAVFARTIYLYWEGGGAVQGLPPGGSVNSYRVTLDNIVVNDDEDSYPLGPGEWRMFANIGSEWFFLNDLTKAQDVLGPVESPPSFGLMIERIPYVLNKSFIVYSWGAAFRIHLDGWEADGIDTIFGKLVNPNSTCDEADTALNSRPYGMFDQGQLFAGTRDDPVGIVNDVFYPQSSSTGTKKTASRGEIFEQEIGGSIDPNNNYVLQYHVENLGKNWTPAPKIPPQTRPPLEGQPCLDPPLC